MNMTFLVEIGRSTTGFLNWKFHQEIVTKDLTVFVRRFSEMNDSNNFYNPSDKSHSEFHQVSIADSASAFKLILFCFVFKSVDSITGSWSAIPAIFDLQPNKRQDGWVQNNWRGSWRWYNCKRNIGILSVSFSNVHGENRRGSHETTFPPTQGFRISQLRLRLLGCWMPHFPSIFDRFVHELYWISKRM